MARYVMANRRAGKFERSEKLAARASMADVLGGSFMAEASVLQENHPTRETARHAVLLEAEPAEMAIKMRDLPNDVIVEPEILHYNDVYCPMDFLGIPREASAAPVLFGETHSTKVKVEGKGKPLYGAEVILFLRAFGGTERELNAITNKSGRVTFKFSTVYSASAMIVVPAGGYWPMVLRGPSDNVTVECPSLPTANKNKGWWHDRLGISTFTKTSGKGMRVGVIDTGIGPHPNLDHVNDVGAFIDGDSDTDAGSDVDSHGSHVCGIIGARPVNNSEYGGITPGVALYSARVFPKGRGANQLDIVNAIDELSREREVDLINMSLGSSISSEVEHDAIIDAWERGTLCICAAGNSNGPVQFPGAFKETVAVSAMGLLGWGPSGSMASIRLPSDPSRFGDENLYHANFSCFGPEIVCGGPGVGYISTVPERFDLTKPYASMGGTSMASPAACAALASILSRSDEYKALPRNQERSAVAIRILRQNCQSIGLDPAYEGHGMPQV